MNVREIDVVGNDYIITRIVEFSRALDGIAGHTKREKLISNFTVCDVALGHLVGQTNKILWPPCLNGLAGE